MYKSFYLSRHDTAFWTKSNLNRYFIHFIFTQIYTLMQEYELPFYQQRDDIMFLLNIIHSKFGAWFYNLPYTRHYVSKSNEDINGPPHERDLCQACSKGVCSAANR